MVCVPVVVALAGDSRAPRIASDARRRLAEIRAVHHETRPPLALVDENEHRVVQDARDVLPRGGPVQRRRGTPLSPRCRL